MATFNVGDTVRSNTSNARGLTSGHDYVVLDARTRYTFVGGFTTYSVRDASNVDAPAFDVVNGHLLLSLVSRAA
jgi:hypothetical protein